MSEDWGAVAAEIIEGLQEVSENKAALVVVAAPGGSPSNPSAAGAPTLYNFTATEDEFTDKEYADGSVAREDIKLFTGAPPLRPDPKRHKLRWAGHDHQIISAKPSRPDGQTAIFYEFHIRP